MLGQYINESPMPLNENSAAPAQPIVVLFDIDGTLLRSGGAARGALELAMQKVLGIPRRPDMIWDGKTDPQIVRDSLQAAGAPDSSETDISPVFDEYIGNLRRAISESPERFRLYPGVSSLLDALAGHSDIVVGLLTGNIEPAAQLKLEAAGAKWDTFKTGSFGSDHASRAELASIAHRRACDLLGGDIKAERIVIIGDTPHDVNCGKSIGARTIGVATGRYSTSDLLAAGADYAFENLDPTQGVLAAIVDPNLLFAR